MSKQVRPVCVFHRIEMNVAKNDYRVRTNAGFGPYEIHSGDLWECPIGGEQIVSGWGSGAIAQHFEDGFAEEPFDLDLQHVTRNSEVVS